ncbi:MAG: hypothetical protein KDD47_14660, partial [Acidobacteria bacterium]|nr:hypothetical protein [Acidobacteriota bacterium]
RAPGWAGVLAGAAVWCRPDALAGVVILGAMHLIEERRLSWLYVLTACITRFFGGLWIHHYFGTVLPITFESKRLLAELSPGNAGGLGFWLSAAPIWKRHGGVLAFEIAAMGLAGQYFVLRHGGRASRLLSVYGLALAAAYPLLGVPYFNWYSLPTAVAILYGAAFFALRAGRALGRWIGEAEGGPWIGRSQDGPRIGFAVSVVLVTLTLFSFGERNLYFFNRHEWPQRMVLYRQAAEWIRENSEPTADVSALEIGAVGYYSRRPLEDLLGMVTPRALPFLAEKDLRGVFRDKPTEFLLRYNQGGRLSRFFRSRWLRRNYEVVRTFSDPSQAHVLRIYRRKVPAAPA